MTKSEGEKTIIQRSLENWDEVRVAYHVARLGTLSAAASYLGVHHATVIRHIDALEAKLGSKLFQRNPRGYNPTEAGQQLAETAAKVEQSLTELAGSIKGHSEAISGELIITSLAALSPQLSPLLIEFGHMHPDIRIKLIADDRMLQLEYGEAHVAVRAGSKPMELNNVVQRLGALSGTLFAHKSYVEKFGPLKDDADAVNHQFIQRFTTTQRAPILTWFRQHVPDQCIKYSVSEVRDYEDAIYRGAGIGFLITEPAETNPDLVQMREPLPEWDTPLWLVTHMDLHRMAKVQALTKFLKERFQK